MYRFLLSILFLLHFSFVPAQSFTLDSTCRIISVSDDNLYPKWSPDGTQLLFQSNKNGNWDIFMFDFEQDTMLQLTESPANEQHPVWFGDGNTIVFDADRGGVNFLYQMDREDQEARKLFQRKIECRQASFSPSKRLVYFSGFDRHSAGWAIYSYDFVSDNLNKLTKLKGDCILPAISPNGKQVLLQRKSQYYPYNRLVLLNWYGKLEGEIDSIPALEPGWGPDGLKIYFVSRKDDLQGEVYSIWKDGTHLERLTNDGLTVRTPSVSPDGRKMALSVLTENGFEIFIIPLEYY